MRQLIFIFLVTISFSALGQSCDNIDETISTWTYDSLINQGTVLIIKGLFDNSEKRTDRFEIAICLFDAAIRRNEKDANAYSWRGLAKMSMGQFELALVDYSKASKLEPNNFKHYEDKADCKFKLEDSYGAIEDYLNAIRRTNEKDYSEYHRLVGSLAMCYYAQNKLDLALTNINKAIIMNGENSKYYLVRGLIKVDQRKIREACLDFSKAGELGNPQAFVSIREYCNK